MPIRAFRHQIACPPSDRFDSSVLPEVGPVEIVRDVDVPSPELTRLAIQGVIPPEVEIVLADGAQGILLKYVRVIEVGIDGTQEGVPTESIVLDFRAITWLATETNTFWNLDVGEGGGVHDDGDSESFVFCGLGVPADAFPDEIPFSNLQTGVSKPLVDGRPIGEPVTLVTVASPSTFLHFGQVVGVARMPTVDARFMASGDGGAINERHAIRLVDAWVESVLLETDPSGSLNETIAHRGDRITWTAQTGSVMTEWEPASIR